MKVIALCRSVPGSTGSIGISNYRVLHDDGKKRNDLMAMMMVARAMRNAEREAYIETSTETVWIPQGQLKQFFEIYSNISWEIN